MFTTRGIAGTGLHYEQSGAGVPILLIHPSGASAATWGGAVDDLATSGRVIVYDRRGYARTGGDPVRSIAGHTADAAALLDESGILGAVVAGTSVGATIAIDLARTRPDLVRAVVAHESPWHVTRQRPARSEIVALSKMTWLSARHRYPEAAAAFLRFAYGYRDGGSAWDLFPEEYRQVAVDNAEAALTDIRIAVGDYPTAEQLAEISTPVVCTCGARSRQKMVRVTRRLAAAIPDATFRWIDAAGHAAPFDSPSGFAAAITEAIGVSNR